MKKKRVGDILASGLFLVGLWILSFLLQIAEPVGRWCGIIGAIIIVIAEGVFLWQSWIKK